MSMEKAIFGLFGLILLINLTSTGIIIFVALHFLLKVW